jgi:hypothetical protein
MTLDLKTVLTTRVIQLISSKFQNLWSQRILNIGRPKINLLKYRNVITASCRVTLRLFETKTCGRSSDNFPKS